MSDRRDDFGSDVDFALLTFSDPKYLRAYRHRTGWDLPILTDRDRSVYNQFGYRRGSLWKVWGPKVFKHYWSLLRDRSRNASRDRVGGLEKATEDTRQLGGDVVIAADGSTAWIYSGEGPDDRPTVEAMIAAVETARRTQP